MNIQPLNHNIVEVDKSYGKEENGFILAEREGHKYEKTTQVGIIQKPIKNGNYQEGSTVYFDHSSCDKDFEFNGKDFYGVRDVEIYAYEEDGEIKSKDFIVCKQLIKEYNSGLISLTKSSIEKYNRKNDQEFTVVYSPYPEVKEGDNLIVKKDFDYPIPQLELSFIHPRDVLILNGKTNLTKVEPYDFKNEHNGLSVEAGVRSNASFGKCGDDIVIYKKSASYDGNYYLDKSEIIARYEEIRD